MNGANYDDKEAKIDLAVPAILVDSEPDVITNAIQKLMFGRKVNIASNAFKEDYKLMIERSPATDDRGQPLNGREPMQPGIVFSLFMDDDRCLLRRDDTDDVVVLEPSDKVSCKPM